LQTGKQTPVASDQKTNQPTAFIKLHIHNEHIRDFFNDSALYKCSLNNNNNNNNTWTNIEQTCR